MAKKRQAATQVATATVKEEKQEAPVLVRVRAIRKGYHNELLRNDGEVFLFDTRMMEPAPSEKEVEGYADLEPADRTARENRLKDFEVITVAGKEYLLPTWVEVAGEGDNAPPVSEPAGHPKVATRDNVI